MTDSPAGEVDAGIVDDRGGLVKGSVTYWGGATVAIEIEGISFVIDPYVAPVPLDMRYAMITHEHYDHFYEPALRRLRQQGQLSMVLASPSCFVASRIESPTASDPEPEDLRWLPPDCSIALHPEIRPAELEYAGASVVHAGGLRVVGVSSGENPRFWSDGSPIDGDAPAGAAGEIYADGAAAPCPTVGFFVEHERTGWSMYHPGDLTYTFPELSALEGSVDVLFLPIGKLNGEEAKLIELVKPRCVVPIHYRLPDPDWPVPLTVHPSEITTADWETGHPKPGVRWDDERYLADVERLIRGHWYPSPNDPVAFVKHLRTELVAGSVVHMLQAGTPYRIDAAGTLVGDFLL